MAALPRFSLVLAITLAALEARPVAAQSTPPAVDRWQVTLDDDRYIWDVRLVGLSGDTLIVRQADTVVRAPVARIHELRMFQKTELRVGDEHESAIRALTGGYDTVYDLALLEPAARRRAIEDILANHSPPGPSH